MSIDRQRAIKILQLYSKQNICKLLINNLFGVQKDFINDATRVKALLASRRFGKSYLAATYLIHEALRVPKSTNIYLSLTRESAEAIMWKDNLKHIMDKFGIKYRFYSSKLTIVFENGSQIKLYGANHPDISAKLRGQKYQLAILDESQDFTQELTDLVYQVLNPAMIDMQGTICLLGTPGNIIETTNYPLFYSVTNHMLPQWAVYHGNTLDNPNMRVNFQKEIDEQVANDPEFLNSITYKQEYLGQWVLNTDRLVYKFDPQKNITSKLPSHASDYTYLMGIDFGYNDSMGFTLGAYSKYDPNLYIVETYKRNKMLISDVEIKLKEFSEKYNISQYICDHSSQAVEELRSRLHYNFVYAEKKDKFNFISMMNSDLNSGKIKLLPNNDKLKAEWNSLLWDKKSSKPKELDSCENHLADSALYLWRYSKNYRAKQAPTIHQPNTESYLMNRLSNKLQKNKYKSYDEELSSAEVDFEDIFNYDE